MVMLSFTEYGLSAVSTLRAGALVKAGLLVAFSGLPVRQWH